MLNAQYVRIGEKNVHLRPDHAIIYFYLGHTGSFEPSIRVELWGDGHDWKEDRSVRAVLAWRTEPSSAGMIFHSFTYDLLGDLDGTLARQALKNAKLELPFKKAIKKCVESYAG